jgi:hypothetical protein
MAEIGSDRSAFGMKLVAADMIHGYFLRCRRPQKDYGGSAGATRNLVLPYPTTPSLHREE